MLDERRDVAPSLAERGQHNREDMQAVVEICAECALLHGLLQVLIGGGDHPHVRPNRLPAPDPLELALLQHPQERNLGLGRQIPDLVEEERPPFRLFEAAQMPLERARERPLLMTEQLRGDQRRRDRGAVDIDEALRGSSGPFVDGARDDLLARPCLSQNQHCRIRGRHHRDFVQHRPQSGARPDDVRKFARRTVRPSRPRLPGPSHPLLNGIQEGLLLERLRQEVHRARLDRPHRGRNIGVAGEKDDREVRPNLGQLLLQVESRDSGELEIQHQTAPLVCPAARQELLG